MMRFSSKRERNLWGGTVVVVVAIYATLGLAPPLSRALRDRGLIEEAALLGMLLVLATIVTLGLTARHGSNGNPSDGNSRSGNRGFDIPLTGIPWAGFGVALGVAAVYLLLFVRMNATPEERTHLMEYGVVAAFIYGALKERASRGRRVPVPAVLAALSTSLLGVLDECIQAALPNRVFDPSDILFNVLAAVMAVVAMLVLSWAQRQTSKARPSKE